MSHFQLHFMTRKYEKFQHTPDAALEIHPGYGFPGREWTSFAAVGASLEFDMDPKSRVDWLEKKTAWIQ